MLLAFMSLATAGTLPAWEVSDFGQTEGYFIGNSDWSGGYSDDPWYVYYGIVLTATDQNVNDNYEGWGNDTAIDNWIVRGDAIGDVSVTVTWTNEDDDSTGVVANLSDARTYYLFLVTSGNAPPPADAVERSSVAILYRVSGGEAEVLANEEIESIDGGDEFELALTVDDGAITAAFNGDTVLEATDSAPLPPGMAGMYAYDTGYDGGWGNTSAWVSYISVHWIDEDDDTVADDVDNCEEVANTDQADADADSIGDLCDPTPGTDDTGDDTGDGGNTDSDNTVTLKGDCACASGPSTPTAGLLTALALALGLRRRR